MPAGMLKIATCQFAVSSSINRNARQIHKFIKTAASAGADIVHLPECALSGYGGADFDTFEDFDWQLLKEQTLEIMALAKKLKLHIVLGSTHKLTGSNKPHNSLYLIGPKGTILDRYDKRFCMSRDLQYYTPGNKFVTFTVKGVKCALLICFDVRFPELYRQLRKLDVDCVLQSFYNARQPGPSVHTHIMRQSMQCRAATNFFWVSLANSSGYYSPYPSCFIRPDGFIVKQLGQNRAGLMVNTVDTKMRLYDPMADFREMAMKGKCDNRPANIRDPRSKDTTCL
jgi:predicted amidohydrolase